MNFHTKPFYLIKVSGVTIHEPSSLTVIIYRITDDSFEQWNSLCGYFVQHFIYQLIKPSKKSYGTRYT